MTPRKFWKEKPKELIESVCAAAGTTMGNFQQIALYRGDGSGRGPVSSKLATRLAEASSGEMTELEILYPERYEENKAA